MSTEILFAEEARSKEFEGIKEKCRAIRITIGPRGQNVTLPNGKMTNDGKTIGTAMTSSDPYKQQGYEVIDDIIESTDEEARDGTTTSAVLAEKLATEGQKMVSMGVNSMMLRKGMERAVFDAKEELKKLVKPVKTLEEVIRAATISAESREIGEVIGKTVWNTGKDGIVTVEESPVPGIYSEMVEGLQFDKGYISPYMVTNKEKMETVLENIPILITDRSFMSGKEIYNVVVAAVNLGYSNLVIVADDFSEDAIRTIISNLVQWIQFAGSKGGIKILAIKAPSFGDKKKEYLEDLSILTNSTIVDASVPWKFDTAFPEDHLKSVTGIVKKIECKKSSTVVKGTATKATLATHLSMLQNIFNNEKHEFQKHKVQERIARLTNGIAVIKVGTETEKTLHYLKDKIDDAIYTAKNALDEGMVAGGGTALVKVHDLMEFAGDQNTDPEFKAGWFLVRDSLVAPFRAIVENAGKSPDNLLLKVSESKSKTFGYNALTDTFEDLIQSGVVDAVKTTRTALEKSVEGIALWLTGGATIVLEKEKEII